MESFDTDDAIAQDRRSESPQFDDNRALLLRVDDDDEPNRHRIGERFHGANFGTIAIDWDATAEGGPPAVTLAIHDVEGKVVRSVEIPAAELAPARVP